MSSSQIKNIFAAPVLSEYIYVVWNRKCFLGNPPQGIEIGSLPKTSTNICNGLSNNDNNIYVVFMHTASFTAHRDVQATLSCIKKTIIFKGNWDILLYELEVDPRMHRTHKYVCVCLYVFIWQYL